MIYQHECKYKIIYDQKGYRHFLFSKQYVRFLHLQCKTCGRVRDSILELPCNKCESNALKKAIKPLLKTQSSNNKTHSIMLIVCGIILAIVAIFSSNLFFAFLSAIFIGWGGVVRY